MQYIAGKNTETDSVFWIQFSYSGIVNYSEMPIPTGECVTALPK